VAAARGEFAQLVPVGEALQRPTDREPVIEVRESVIGEPAGPVLVFTNKNRTAIAVIVDGKAAEVTLEPAALGWLEAICSG
jgi:hypothetical protein